MRSTPEEIARKVKVAEEMFRNGKNGSEVRELLKKKFGSSLGGDHVHRLRREVLGLKKRNRSSRTKRRKHLTPIDVPVAAKKQQSAESLITSAAGLIKRMKQDGIESMCVHADGRVVLSVSVGDL